jgi:hypothetical protein
VEVDTADGCLFAPVRRTLPEQMKASHESALATLASLFRCWYRRGAFKLVFTGRRHQNYYTKDILRAPPALRLSVLDVFAWLKVSSAALHVVENTLECAFESYRRSLCNKLISAIHSYRDYRYRGLRVNSAFADASSDSIGESSGEMLRPRHHLY